MSHRPRPLRRAIVGVILAATVLAVTPGVAAGTAREDAPARLVVRYAPGTPSAASDRALAVAQVARTERISRLGLDVVEVPGARADAAVRALLSAPGVVSVEPDTVVQIADLTPNDPFWPRQWGSVKIGAPSAWDLTQGDAGTVVAVLDTGIDASHPDFEGALVAGVDLVNGDEDPSDDHVNPDGTAAGHGTMVAGVVAARANNGLGVAGMCWRCVVMPVKVLGADGSGRGSTAAEGIVWAVDNGADVVNMSFGSTDGSVALETAVQYARRRGVIVVAAAGNAGDDVPTYPAAYSSVIGVAGTDEADARYSWSAFGDWVAMAAPGCIGTTKVGERYGDMCGTSAAAPLVAGALALGRSRHPRASVDHLRSSVLATATDVGPIVASGRLEARRFLDALDVAMTCPSGVVPDPGFSDVDAATPQGEAVACAVWWGLASQGETYRPGVLVTRGQMATFIVRTVEAAGIALPVTVDQFSDDNGTAHERRINQLVSSGIVGGRSDGTFGPDEPVTRAQMATFLVRAVEFVSGAPLAAGANAFPDDDTNPHAGNIDKAAAAGMVGGRADGTYGPGESVTRGQMAIFLRNVLRVLVARGLATPPTG